MSTYAFDRITSHLSFKRIGDPNTSLGTTLVAGYGGELIFEHTAITGRRKKFIVRDEGLIIKAAPTFRPGRLISEGDVWPNIPRPLQRHFSEPLAWGTAHIEAPQPGTRPPATEHVHWVVQRLVEGTDNVSFLDFKDRLIAAESAGFYCHDANPRQLRQLPSGHILWLDYELWERRESSTTH